MAQRYGDAHLEWIKSAEEAIKRGDYEAAAQFLRYVTIHFGLANETSDHRKFAIKTGECYLKAAKKLEEEGDLLKAILLCIKASDSFQEGESKDLTRVCDVMIRKYHASVARDGAIGFNTETHDSRKIGDYFAKNGQLERAIECYRTAAVNASREEKLALSGGLYKNIGDCYQILGDFDSAAKSYATAADMYFQCGDCFWAALRYCESGFLFIYTGKLEDASIMARKAGLACDKGRIDVLLNGLSYVCRSLSEGDIYEAQEHWNRIRLKFKRSYVKSVDSCFRAMRKT